MTEQDIEQIDQALAAYFSHLNDTIKEAKPDFSKLPTPQVHVTVPEIKVPEIKVPPVKIPDFPPFPPFPPIHVPAPKVDVKIPPAERFDDKKILEALKKLVEKRWSYYGGGPTEYVSGSTYPATGVQGPTFTWEDVGQVMRTVSTTKPLPVNLYGNLLIPKKYDYVGFSYPDPVTEVLAFKSGGASGTAITTITLVYTDSSKTDIVTITAA